MMDDNEKCKIATLASIEEEYNDTQLLVTNILDDVVGTVVKAVDRKPEEETEQTYEAVEVESTEENFIEEEQFIVDNGNHISCEDSARCEELIEMDIDDDVEEYKEIESQEKNSGNELSNSAAECEVLVSAVADNSNDNVFETSSSALAVSSHTESLSNKSKTLTDTTIVNSSSAVAVTPRATRSSQNPDFAAKHRKFLNRVHDSIVKRDIDSNSDDSSPNTSPSNSPSKDSCNNHKSMKDSLVTKRYSIDSSDIRQQCSNYETASKRKRGASLSNKPDGSTDGSENDSDMKKRKGVKIEKFEPTLVGNGVDSYCWRCHRDGNVIRCDTCPRVYHLRCIHMDSPPNKGWACPECSAILHAENVDTRSRAMRMLSLDQLCNLLRFTVNRMKSYEGSEEFWKPVDTNAFPNYRNFIIKPMDLQQLERNIKNNMYGSTEAFLADAKWILHNSIIFNSVQSKITNVARQLLKICKQEMLEIENCPDCYQNAHTRSTDSWFIEVCRKPHRLVWAKLKGFPFWPAKAMSTNSENQVDVRFFGAHDRAWVPVNACFLYSKMSPAPNNKKKNNLEECIQELEQHIKKLRDKYGSFEHAPYKTPYDPNKEDEQLKMLIPNYDPNISMSKRVGRLIHERAARPPVSPQKKNSLVIKKEGDTSEQRINKEKQNSNNQNNSTKLKENKEDSIAPKINLKRRLSNTTGNVTDQSDKPKSYENNLENDVNSSGDAKIQKLDFDSTLQCSSPYITNFLECNKATAKDREMKISFVDKLQEKLARYEKEEKELMTLEETKTKLATDANKKDVSSDETSSNPSTSNVLEQVVYKQKQVENTVVKTVVSENVIKSTDTDKEINNADTEHEVNTAKDSGSSTANAHELEVKQGNELNKNIDNQSKAESSLVIKVNPVVVLHDLKDSSSCKTQFQVNDKEGERECDLYSDNVDKIIENEVEEIIPDATAVEDIVDVTENDNNLTTDIFFNSDKDDDTNKKKNNINNVVKNIKERKTSSDSADSIHEIESERKSPESVESDKECDNNVSVVKVISEKLMLDSNEYPLVIIDENQEDEISQKSNKVVEVDKDSKDKAIRNNLENDSKQNNDKSRRKGIPAKCSRSSTSSDETPSSQEAYKKLVDCHIDEVLDEVSGRFKKRSNHSEDPNVTITLISDDDTTSNKSQKVKQKDIRASVNLSKNISLSVVGESVTASLDMECESDTEDPVILDTYNSSSSSSHNSSHSSSNNISNYQKTTARKTLPQKPASTPKVPVLHQKGSSNKVQNQRRPSGMSTDNAPYEGIKVKSPLSLLSAMSPPPVNLPCDESATSVKLNNSVSIKLQNGQTQSPVVRNVMASNPRQLPPPLHIPTQPSPGAGPISKQLDNYSHKIGGYVRGMLEEMLRDISADGNPEATIKLLKMEIERLQWQHRQEMADLKHNTDLVMMEMRASLESEKQRALLEIKHKYEVEKEAAIQETKRKQWCAYCRKEAQLYCCWNTAYCSYPCQQSHWMQHMNVCAQNAIRSGNENIGNKPPVRSNNGTNNPNILTATPKAYCIQPQVGQIGPVRSAIMRSVQNEEVYNISDNHGIEQPYNFLNENLDNSNKKQVRRKPCGMCDGCKRTVNCGQCSPCLNSNSHQICKSRKCYQLCSKNTENKFQRHCNLNSVKHGMQFVPLNVPPRNLVPRHPGQFIPLMQQGGTHFQIGPTDQRPYQQMIHIN